MHTDAKKLKNLFNEFSNVRAAFSGHVHLADKTEYLGVKYFCNGAVCGGWWRGPRDGHPEGFNLVHVYEDGIENEYVTYGWDASKYEQTALDPELFPFVHYGSRIT